MNNFDFKKFHLKGIVFFSIANVILSSFILLAFGIYQYVMLSRGNSYYANEPIPFQIIFLVFGVISFFIFRYFRKRLRRYLAEIHNN